MCQEVWPSTRHGQTVLVHLLCCPELHQQRQIKPYKPDLSKNKTLQLLECQAQTGKAKGKCLGFINRALSLVLKEWPWNFSAVSISEAREGRLGTGNNSSYK